MQSFVRATLALTVLVVATACSSADDNSNKSDSSTLPLSAVDAALLPIDQVDAAMGTTAMVKNSSFTDSPDDSPLLPNLNCLGIYQVGERAVYADSGLSAITGQILRQPDTEDWLTQVAQAGAVYPSPEAATAFFNASADRWSKCTNHTVNITVNDGPRTSFRFGEFGRTSTHLTMSFTRNETERSCQRALSVVTNVVIDVKACSQAPTEAATKIAQQIEDGLKN